MSIALRTLSELSPDEIAVLAGGASLPPVDLWHPTAEQDSLMRITADGQWFHDGGLIRRPAMVRAFSTLLRREPDGRYALVTPYEKQWIAVEDLPFLAVEMQAHGDGRDAMLHFRLNTGDVIRADADHPLHLTDKDGAANPWLHVRGALKARIARPLFYDLVERALADESGPPGLWSGGSFFALDGASA